MKVSADELTFRPATELAAAAAAAAPKPADAGAAGADKAADPASSEQQLTISKSATRVTIAAVTDEHAAPTGRGVVQSITYRSGTLADLKPNQLVIICIRDETAAKITILVADRKS